MIGAGSCSEPPASGFPYHYSSAREPPSPIPKEGGRAPPVWCADECPIPERVRVENGQFAALRGSERRRRTRSSSGRCPSRIRRSRARSQQGPERWRAGGPCGPRMPAREQRDRCRVLGRLCLPWDHPLGTPRVAPTETAFEDSIARTFNRLTRELSSLMAGKGAGRLRRTTGRGVNTAT